MECLISITPLPGLGVRDARQVGGDSAFLFQPRADEDVARAAGGVARGGGGARQGRHHELRQQVRRQAVGLPRRLEPAGRRVGRWGPHRMSEDGIWWHEMV